jgi:hypothetical protein
MFSAWEHVRLETGAEQRIDIFRRIEGGVAGLFVLPACCRRQELAKRRRSYTHDAADQLRLQLLGPIRSIAQAGKDWNAAHAVIGFSESAQITHEPNERGLGLFARGVHALTGGLTNVAGPAAVLILDHIQLAMLQLSIGGVDDGVFPFV